MKFCEMVKLTYWWLCWTI